MCMRARAKFYQTVSSYVVVCGVLPSKSSLSTHTHTYIHTRTYIYTTVTIQEDYIDWYARRKREKEREREEYMYNSYTTSVNNKSVQ